MKLNYAIQQHEEITAQDNKLVLASVSDTQDPSSPMIYILNIYVPAERTGRLHFFRSLAANQALMTQLRSSTVPTITVGNFNYDIHKKSNIDADWATLLSVLYHSCFEHEQLPTFVGTTGNRSHIDYIFCSSSHASNIKSMSQSFVKYSWTDHALLTTHYQLSSAAMGKGSWKGNLFLAKLAAFREGLTDHITKHVEQENLLDPNSGKSARDIWD